jgi:cellulose synthase operon protein B
MRVQDLSVVRASVAIALALLAFGAAPAALAASLADLSPVASAAPLLKRLPASRSELIFRGENASREWLIYLSPAEAARAASFQIAVLNAVVVLPDRSWLKLIVNGRQLSSLPIRSPDGVTTVRVRIPPGVLTPGANKVQMKVALTHRVDCSVKATYELWALLDPVRTGILLEGGSGFPVRSLDDIAAEPAAEDGATHIHLRLPDSPDPDSVSRAARFINVLVRRAQLARPVVDVGPDAGEGAGFDVVVASGSAQDEAIAGLRVLGHESGVTLGRDPATGRLVVALSGATDAELDDRIAELDKAAPKENAARALAEGVSIEAGAHKTFAQLGLETENFTGRRYLSTVNLRLPADFFPASHDRVRLLIDGGHSSALDQNSELIFRVNGAIVSSMALAAGAAEQFERRIVELPLRSFRPGLNELAIEAITSSPLDRQCDFISAHRDTRLTIAATSELEFPQFAHLAAIPQIPAALSGEPGALSGGPLNLYLPDLDRGTIAVALTALANMGPQAGRPEAPLVHLDSPAADDPPGLVIAPLDQLPENLVAPVRRLIAPAAPVNDAAGLAQATPADPAPDPMNFKLDWSGLVEAGLSALRSRGFFFYRGDRDAGALPFSANALLIGAVSPAPPPLTVGGAEIPQFVHDASQWLVITGQSPQAYEVGLERLVANGQWSGLAGEAATFDAASDQLRSVQPARVAYVVPDRFVLSDMRPILGGIVSDNILLSLGALILLMSILGLSTHALIRRMGAR